MSVLQVGRVFDTLDVDVSSVSWSGDVLTLAGDLNLGAVTAADRPETAAAVRDRINSLVTASGEIDVPVIWSEDPSVDWFYRPLSARVDYSVASLNDGYLNWEIQLQKVGGGALPQCEVVTTLSHITNGLSASLSTINTAAVLMIGACPNDAYDAWNGYTSAAGQDRVAESGTVATWDLTPSSGAAIPLKLNQTFTVRPSDFYDGACSLRGTYAGLANQLCLGDMAPEVNGMVLSNGMLRVKVTGGALTIECYDSGAWVTTSATDWIVTGTAGAGTILDFDAAPNVSVLYNTPEAVAVRLLCGPGTTATALGRVWLDISLHRGARIAAFEVKADTAATWDVRSSTPIAGTTMTGGVRETSNDANGNRLIVAGSGDTRNLVSIGVSNTASSKSMAFGLGVELNGSSAANNDQAQKVLYEFFVGRSDVQRIVRR